MLQLLIGLRDEEGLAPSLDCDAMGIHVISVSKHPKTVFKLIFMIITKRL